MARSYLVGSWNDADTYDYSGEQLMGSRHSTSVCADHMLPNGKANLARYRDAEESKPAAKAKKKTPIQYKICPASRTLDRLEAMKEELEEERQNGMEIGDYIRLSAILDQKIDKAYALMSKQMQWDDLSIDELQAAIEETEKRQRQLEREDADYWEDDVEIDEQQLEAEQWQESISSNKAIEKDNSIFLELPVDNCFRKAYLTYSKIKTFFNKCG